MHARDIGDLARLHVSCLDDSLVGVLGAAYVREFYGYVTRSPQEVVVVRRTDAGTMVAAAVVSLEPTTLNRRLLRETPLLRSAATHLAAVTAMLWTSARRPRGATRAAGAPSPAPEVILMFTAAAARQQGHGAAMIGEIDRRLRRLGVPVYQVRTVSDPANPALNFYRRRGFVPCGISFRAGTCFQVFSRTVPSDDGHG